MTKNKILNVFTHDYKHLLHLHVQSRETDQVCMIDACYSRKHCKRTASKVHFIFYIELSYDFGIYGPKSFEGSILGQLVFLSLVTLRMYECQVFHSR